MNVIDQLIREVKKSLLTVHVCDGSKTVSIEYDKDCKIFKTTIVLPCRPKKVIIGEENTIYVLSKLSKESIEKALNDIKDENNRHYVAKLRLIRIAIDNFEDEDIIKILKLLDVVCVPYRYVGMGNRYSINKYTHLRLADDTCWNTSGALHLQKVLTNDDANITLHDYPKISELDLLKEFVSL